MNKKFLKESLRVMLQNFVQVTRPEAERYGKRREVLGSDGVSRFLVNEGVDAFIESIDDINTDPVIGSKVSSSKVAKSIWTLLLAFEDKLNTSDEELETGIREQLATLRSLPSKWVVQAPIKNIIFANFTELRIGKVTFFKTSYLRSRTVREMGGKSVVPSLSDEQEAEREGNLSRELDRVYSSADVCAELHLEAESARLSELAYSEIDASLNLLRCYTHLLFHRTSNVRIGLGGEPTYWVRDMLSFPEGESELSIVTHVKGIGSLEPYRLNAATVKELKERFSLDLLSELIAKPDSERSTIEQAVVTAIRWLGRGIVAPDLPERVLNFAAASERLLIGDNESKSEIAERYSRRLAFLNGETPLERSRISSRARELYKVRNAVIHAGKTDVEQKDVEDMETLIFDALLRMAKHTDMWRDHRQFADWVEKQIFKIT